jgi:hypothetical protein
MLCHELNNDYIRLVNRVNTYCYDNGYFYTFITSENGSIARHKFIMQIFVLGEQCMHED